MPQTRLTCPHCEQEVELNVTDVTRSRDCPRCGKYIILQFTTKATRMKRKALLTPTVQLGGEAAAAAGGARSNVVARPQGTSVVTGRDTPRTMPAPSPRVAPVAGSKPLAGGSLAPMPVVAQTLEGSSGERLLHDSDIKRKGNTILWGVGVVVALIALVIAADRFHWWRALGNGFSGMMTVLSPPKVEPLGESRKVEVDPALPSAKEVLSTPVQAPEMKLPEEVDSAPATTPGVMSEQEMAMRAVQSFLEATTLKDRVKLVRDDHLMVDKMVKYYESHEPGRIAYQKIVAKEANPAGMLTFAFEVILPDGEHRRVITMKSRTGKYFIDWASFVLYGDMGWKEFMDVRPVTPTLMRVLAEPGEHFNDVFPKAANLICLKLTDPRSKDAPPIYGYATEGTPLGMALEFILRKGSSEPQPITVTLKYREDVAGGEANQVLVDELVAEGWLARGR
ncbi:hypothetical protein DES53_102952 [Roseimicrobium gellanilyticum]|uniref:Uncharacterized protein n=1 Tax=Roseimicrobium gellanilyticum TaxID=748857 RepID=A0A366HSA7_9BACT|nr:hypothetical protein [Roseimicrobium gellanilyticum]RBP46561.1 hypothetical protein DES53_102952 [Roseimicrobium gellanilyticum]